MAALAESELPHAGRGAALAWRLASDDAVVRAVARGHDGAFAALFQRYHGPLVRYCRSMLLDADDAQDAAQNALASALRALRGERTLPLRLKPWLYRIARNEALAIAQRRRARPTVSIDDEVELLAAPDDGDTRETLRELLGDLRALPERQRSALVLRELEGLSYSEVAGALDVSQDAARQAVFEARSALWASRDGRASSCVDVQRRLSEGDGRTARARDLRAHLATCADCTAFAEQIAGRRRALRLLFPLPSLVAMGSGSGWALAGLGGASVATKCAAVCATAVMLGGSVAALETTRHLHAGGNGIVSATAGPTPATHPHRAPRPAAAAAVRAVAATTTQAARTPAPQRHSVALVTRRSAPSGHHAPVAHLPRTTSHVPAAPTTTAPAPPPAPATTTAPVPTAPPTQQASATQAAIDLAAQRREQLAAALTAARDSVQQQLTAARQQVTQLVTDVQTATTTATQPWQQLAQQVTAAITRSSTVPATPPQ